MSAVSVLLYLLGGVFAQEPTPVRLASDPSLSPDGKTLVFAWAGDLWTVPVSGGSARPITRHPARETQPWFSPDGKSLAFVSYRTGSRQVFVMTLPGGVPEQVTFHSAGHSLHGWFPDGKSVLVRRMGDTFWRSSSRFWKAPVDRRAAPEMIFDAYGDDASLVRNGRRLLFTREGSRWWRKGYRGSREGQIWLYDLKRKSFKKILAPEAEKVVEDGGDADDHDVREDHLVPSEGPFLIHSRVPNPATLEATPEAQNPVHGGCTLIGARNLAGVNFEGCPGKLSLSKLCPP